MRLAPERLREITHKETPKTQASWFLKHMGVAVPYDNFGPILTDASYEKLLEKRLGLGASSLVQDQPRPSVRLRTV